MANQKITAWFGFNCGTAQLTQEQEQDGVMIQEQDQRIQSIHTDKAIHNLANNVQEIYEYIDVLGKTVTNGDQRKDHVLESLADHIIKQGKWFFIRVHYNGHGTVIPKQTKILAGDAGRWCCSKNQYIAIEDVLNTIEQSLSQPVEFVQVYADCCGAAGAYYRLKSKLRNKSLKLNKIPEVWISASAQYWQKSYADQNGGYYTQAVTTRSYDSFKCTTKFKNIEGIEVGLVLDQHEDTIRNFP